MISPIASTDMKRWCYTSLIFSLFYFLPTVVRFHELSWGAIINQALFYLGFLALYILGTRVEVPHVHRVLILLMVVLFWGSSFTAGTSSLFGYVLFLSSFYYGLKRAVLFAGLVITLIVASAAWFHDFSLYFVWPAIAVALGIFLYGRLSRKEYMYVCAQKKHNKEVKRLATIAERERIARDLHDLLGHSLSTIAIKAELSQKWLASQSYDKAITELNELASLARSSLSEVRCAVTNIKQKGLLSTVNNFCHQLKQLGFTVEENISSINLLDSVESACTMLIKEWSTNILRHSRGGHVKISISQPKKVLRITVQNSDQLDALYEGNGIQGMRERVEDLGGTMTITFDLEVCLDIHIPLAVP